MNKQDDNFGKREYYFTIRAPYSKSNIIFIAFVLGNHGAKQYALS